MLHLKEHHHSYRSLPGNDWRRPLRLHHIDIGNAKARPLIMLVGLGMQAFEWPQHFLDMLSSTQRVICVENRDAGHSPRCGPESEPNIADIWLAEDEQAASKTAPYSLFDMRDDVLALIASFKIHDFDIIGFSLGGMIAQLVAAAMGDRVGSFIQLASNDGSNHVGSTDGAKRRIARLFKEPADRRSLKDDLLDDALYYGAGHLKLDDELRAEIEKASRGFSCGGSARHALAVLAAGDRRAHLRSITAKTLILNGKCDPCIAATKGQMAANLIPNAQYKQLPDLGHIVEARMCSAALDWLNDHSSKQV